MGFDTIEINLVSVDISYYSKFSFSLLSLEMRALLTWKKVFKSFHKNWKIVWKMILNGSEKSREEYLSNRGIFIKKFTYRSNTNYIKKFSILFE